MPTTMRYRLFVFATVLGLVMLAAAVISNQRKQSERIVELDRRCAELHASLQARDTFIEGLRADPSGQRLAGVSSGSSMHAGLSQQIAELLGMQSNMLAVLQTISERLPDGEVQGVTRSSPEQAQRVIAALRNNRDEEAVKLQECRNRVVEFMSSLNIPDGIALMDPHEALSTPSLQAYWPYFQAKGELDRHDKAVKVLELKLLQETMDAGF
jgi:hypothetical protein